MNWFTGSTPYRHRNRWPELLLPITIIGCLFIIFVPLPASVMDVLLVANISFSVIILLSALYVRMPLEFSVFPSLLLVTTLARLALNIATTRLILSRGSVDHELAAGQLIRGFGEFVAGDQIAIGLAIFLIIVIIQFVVITKGSMRISEVTARFALDGMPGRQTGIDADLNAGVIDGPTAQQQRQELAKQADFYGAMDGASKFVRGDAIVGVFITLVNIVTGLIVGLMANMSAAQAASVYTKLTIGDGLASQLPALLTSLAAAILVTRPNRATNLPQQSYSQLSGKPIVLIITAVFLVVLMATSLPKIPLMAMAAILLLAARFSPGVDAEPELDSRPAATQAGAPEHSIDRLLGNEVFEMELGVDLIPLADPQSGGTLLPTVTKIRKELASDLGVVLPKIRIKDNLQLPPNEYRILVHGNPVELGAIFVQHYLAVDRGKASGPIHGAVATEATQDGQAFWILPQHRDSALQLGYQVMSPTTVLSSRLAHIANQYAPEFLTRDATNQLIQETRKSSPAIVDELLADAVSLKQLQKILKQLVAEQVSIRPLALILESIGDACCGSQPAAWQLVEHIRQQLAPQISARHLQGRRCIKAITINDGLQDCIAGAFKIENDDLIVGSSQVAQALVDALRKGVDCMRSDQIPPIVCVHQDIRPVVRRLTLDNRIETVVLGSREIVGTYVESLGEISLDRDQISDMVAA